MWGLKLKKKEESTTDIVEQLKKQTELTRRALDFIDGGYGGEWKISEEGQSKVNEEYGKGKRLIPVTLKIKRVDGDWFKLWFVYDGVELQNCTTKVLIDDETQLQDLHMTIYK